MDNTEIKKIAGTMMGIDESKMDVIISLERLMERKTENLDFILRKNVLDEQSLKALIKTVKLEYRYLRFIGHKINKIQDYLKLLKADWESKEDEIIELKLGEEAFRLNEELLETWIKVLEEILDLIDFLKKNSLKELNLIEKAAKRNDPRWFVKVYELFWRKTEEKLNAMEIEYKDVKKSLILIARTTASVNNQYFKVNVDDLIVPFFLTLSMGAGIFGVTQSIERSLFITAGAMLFQTMLISAKKFRRRRKRNRFY